MDEADSHATIFIVDDDFGVRESIKALLEPCGFRCLTFESGEAFLDALKSEIAPHGCAVVDLRLKELSGLAVLRELQKNYPYVVAVMITAFTDVKLAFEAMKMGATSIIAKPYQNQELSNAVSTCLAVAMERFAVDGLSDVRD